jgi:hypothetical protein
MPGLPRPLLPNEKAVEVLDFCMNALPIEKTSYDPYVPDLIEAYFAAGATDKAVEMTNALCDFYYGHLTYYLKQNPYIVNSAEYEIQSAIQYTSRVASACTAYGKPELGEEINKKLEDYYKEYVKIVQPSAK